jgi:SAM-dependent methyltransferase
LSDIAARSFAADPCEKLTAQFFASLSPAGGRIIEVGSRNRTGILKRGRIPGAWEYTGVDIMSGENVEIVLDAHELSKTLPRASFDAAFSMAVFEHLLMPWKAAVEINRILKPGGLLMVATHQAWPIHEYPWDYFRFSDSAWQSLFNKATGFEIVDTAMSRRCSVVAHLLLPQTIGLEEQPAYLRSVVVARKIGEPTVDWDVRLSDVVKDWYPI